MSLIEVNTILTQAATNTPIQSYKVPLEGLAKLDQYNITYPCVLIVPKSNRDNKDVVAIDTVSTYSMLLDFIIKPNEGATGELNNVEYVDYIEQLDVIVSQYKYELYNLEVNSYSVTSFSYDLTSASFVDGNVRMPVNLTIEVPISFIC